MLTIRPRRRPRMPGSTELAHPDHGEQVGLEGFPDEVERHLLDRPSPAVPGVVDQHPDRSVGRLDLPDGGGPGLLVGHVQLKDAAARPLQLPEAAGVPRGRPHGEARPGQGQRRRPADARGAAGDEHGP